MLVIKWANTLICKWTIKLNSHCRSPIAIRFFVAKSLSKWILGIVHSALHRFDSAVQPAVLTRPFIALTCPLTFLPVYATEISHPIKRRSGQKCVTIAAETLLLMTVNDRWRRKWPSLFWSFTSSKPAEPGRKPSSAHSSLQHQTGLPHYSEMMTGLRCWKKTEWWTH